jgi:hypothetical protein
MRRLRVCDSDSIENLSRFHPRGDLVSSWFGTGFEGAIDGCQVMVCRDVDADVWWRDELERRGMRSVSSGSDW